MKREERVHSCLGCVHLQHRSPQVWCSWQKKDFAKLGILDLLPLPNSCKGYEPMPKEAVQQLRI